LGIGAQALSDAAAMPARGSRILGLDLVRSAAILLVVADHGAEAIGWAWPVPRLMMNVAGNFGVELFFALSGFLIGRLLLQLPAGPGAFQATRRFWVRRWLRTLPNYYVYFILFALAQPQVNPATAFFVQRFFPGEPQNFFTVAWSLAMEEWFYLLFPLLALVTNAFFPRWDRRRIMLWTAVAAIILPCAARYAILNWQLYSDSLVGELTFVRHPILRFDCCAYGVLLAAFLAGRQERALPALRRLTVPGALLLSSLPLLLFGGLFIMLVEADPAFLKSVDFPAWAFFYFSFSYPLMDCAATGFVAIAYLAGPALRSGPAFLVEGLSRISYSLYLSHTLVNFLWIDSFARLGPWDAAGLRLVLALLLALFTYRLIELPFLRLRDRYFPA
jgi:peptidoglycan/LPS O-acetylase OafA/YrhL